MSASLSIEARDERRAATLLGELVEFDAELSWVGRSRSGEAVDRWLAACD